MRSFLRQRRTIALVFALGLLSFSTKGLCFMPAGQSGPAAAHRCCAGGWQAASTGCCMEGQAGVDPVTVTVRVVAPAPDVVTPRLVLVAPLPGRGGTVASTDRVHSPPPGTILRI